MYLSILLITIKDNDERNELMGSHDNDNPTLLPENDLESEAHRKQ